MPAEPASCKHNVHDDYSEILQIGEENSNLVDIFSIHSSGETGTYLTCLLWCQRNSEEQIKISFIFVSRLLSMHKEIAPC